MRLFVILIATLSGACGSSKEEAKKALDANTVTLNPAPGVYNYRPWVILSKSDDGMGSGILYVKGPGETEFKSASCIGAPYADSATTILADCVEVKQSGTLAYYLENSEAKSDERTEEYTIELPTNSIMVESRATPDGEATPLELAEVETVCDYNTGDKNLEVIIKTKNDDKLTAERYAYVAFNLVEPTAGSTAKFTPENDTEAGIIIKPTSDEMPNYFSGVDYTTDPYVPYSDENTLPDPACEIKIETLERGKVNAGTFACTQLRVDEYSDVQKDILGAFISTSGKWQCDWYR